MVGDHAPSFISELPAKEDKLIDDDGINMRTVPYVVWSNFDMDIACYTDYASMVDLIPMVLKAAQMPLSTFYKNILELHEKLPVHTSEGKGVNRELKVSQYSEESPYYDLWSRYYYMEYNSLLETGEYLEKLFIVP